MKTKLSDTIPEGWTVVTVATVGALRLGRQRSPEKHTGRFATKYLRAANITQDGLDLSDVFEMDFTPAEREVFALRAGDILLAEASGSAAHVGRSAVWQDEIPGCCYQNTVIRFRPHASTTEYAHIVFRHYAESGAFADSARGVGIQHLGLARFGRMPFPLPPLAEQERIGAEVRARLAELREAKHALRAALVRAVEQDRAIIDAAVAGRLVAEIPDSTPQHRTSHEVSTRLEPLLLFPTSGDAAQLRVLPPSWSMRRVGDVGGVRVGLPRSPDRERGSTGTPYLRAANIGTEGVDLTDVRTMHFTEDERRTFALAAGDVLLAEASGSPTQVGRAAVWNGELEGCCFQNTVVRFRSSEVEPEYAYLVFRYFADSGAFARAARGSGIQHLSAGRFSDMPFPLPPRVEQQRIVAEAGARLEASRAQREAIERSLTRTLDMGREVITAAVRGTLVSQSSDDEPAAALLARVGATPAEPASRPTRSKGTTAARRRAAAGTRELADVLREAGRPLRVPDLFAMAGYDRDSPDDVERFYLALRAEIGRSIRGREGENAIVELLNAS